MTERGATHVTERGATHVTERGATQLTERGATHVNESGGRDLGDRPNRTPFESHIFYWRPFQGLHRQPSPTVPAFNLPAALGISESVCIRRAASAAGPALPEHVAVASRSGLDHVPTHARAGTRGAWKWGSWRRAAGVWQAVASLSQAGAAGRIDRDGNAISESETVH